MIVEVTFPKKQIISEPSGGGGIPEVTGDMLKSVYDPTGVESDAFNMENMVEGENKKILTPQERLDFDRGFQHSLMEHAPADAQKNSDITQEEIEAKLKGPITSHTHAGNGFTINILSTSFNPADLGAYHFGNAPVTPTTARAIRKVYIRKLCILNMAEINMMVTGTAGTNEIVELYVRKNDISDHLIAQVGNNNYVIRPFTNLAMGLQFAPGDFFEIKMVCPAWLTNPTGVYFGGYLFFDLP